MIGLLAAAALASHGPLLFAYEGAGTSGLAALPALEALLGRKVDGVDDFTVFTNPTDSLAGLNWSLGSWQGKGYQINFEIPLGFYSGGTTAQIAAGALDSYYKSVGAAFVSHGFATAYIRLGPENNLPNGWPWEGQGATYAKAFQRADTILKATPGSNFTIEYNPGIGQDESVNYPGAAFVGMMSHDAYATGYVGNCAMPVTWACQLGAWWGFGSVGSYPSATTPFSVSEFGVGSRSDGHGDCPLKGQGDCDDGAFLTSALASFTLKGAKFITYWDYDAGDYNSKVSTGERPNEALALVKVFGTPNQIAILTKYATPFTTKVALPLTVTGSCAANAIQNGSAHWMVIAYGSGACSISWGFRASNTNVYDQSVGAAPIKATGAVSSVSLILTHPVDIAIAK